MRKIAVINVYIGKYKNYFHLWKKSAAANPTVDFHLFTDQTLTDLPENVYCHPITLDGFSALASQKIGLDIKLETAYKICDFKVAYGLIFEDFIKEYDFWGHCDIDLIWGDLRHFFTDALLDQYDRLLCWGHLSLYRNTDEVNRRFMLDGWTRADYRTVFTSNRNFAFDESTGITSIYRSHGFSQYDGKIIAAMSFFYHRYRFDNPECDRPYQVFYYENGHVYRAFSADRRNVSVDEYAYIHLHMRHFDKNLLEKYQGTCFYITPKGFFEKEEGVIPDIRTICHYNRFPGRLYEKLEKRIYCMKRNYKNRHSK